MRLLAPSLFWFWAALIAVPIILYLFRPRPKTVRTSTLPFFKWLAREHQDATWLKRLKYWLSLLMTVLAILAVAAAIGGLIAAPDAGEMQTLVIVVDRSASMGATNAEDITRLDAGKSKLRERLAAVPAGVGIVVMAYDQRPEVLLARSLDLRHVQRVIDSITVRAIPGDAAEAIQLARQLAALDTTASIWHVTDSPAVTHSVSESNAPVARSVSKGNSNNPVARSVSEGPSPEHPSDDLVRVERIGVALSEAVNAGITASQLRRLPMEPDRFEAFVQVGGATKDEPIETELEVKLDEDLVAIRKLTVQMGQKETLLLPIRSSATAERQLTLTLRTEGDALADDDIALAHLPKFQPLRVLWISPDPDPFTELALTSLTSDETIVVEQGAPSAWPAKESVDVVLFDGWLPDKWPDSSAAIIVVNPPGSVGPVRAVPLKTGLPHDSVRTIDQQHPLLFGVASQRVAITQTAVVDASGSLQPLWVGQQGPLLLAGETEGQRVVLMAFNPQQSEHLPLLASYPLLIGNAIFWTAQTHLNAATGHNIVTGTQLDTSAESVTWIQPQFGEREAETISVPGGSLELDRVGFWRTTEGLTGAASLLSASESELPIEPASDRDAQQTKGTSFLRGNLVPLLLWFVIGLLVLESCLYHRYWIF